MSFAKGPLSVYDRLRPHLSAEDVLRRLGVEVVRRLGAEAYCRPLCHQSTSGESLQINLHTGRWNCKACQHAGVSGDVIQFVEYWQTGGRAPAQGSQQRHSPSHQDAVRWLCEQFAVPYDDGRDLRHDPALDVVHFFAMAAHQHLVRAPEVLQWIQEKWGFDLSTVEQYGIGFMPSPILPSIAVEANTANKRDAFRSSGIGYYPSEGEFTTRFEGRITFPYWDGGGRAVYLIGRATPWTPRREGEVHVPKYHKLSVHSETRPHISERITNDHLYNEVVMENARVVVVAEGVADAVALSSIGAPVVSPVTISFNEVDLERFVRKCRERGIKRVEILFDNELSGSGNYGAARVARKLAERGICAVLLTLPLAAAQVAAREEVLQWIGQDAFDELEQAEPRRRKEIIAERVQDDAGRAWVASQVEASKIDAAEWVALEGAGAAEKFAGIRRVGQDVVLGEIAAAAVGVDPEAPAQDRAAAFEGVITLAACVDDRIVRGEYAGAIAKAAGRGVTKADVAQRISAARKPLLAERREVEEEQEEQAEAAAPPLVVLPPQSPHARPPAPPKPQDPSKPPAPPPPGAAPVSEHDRYAPVRAAVARAIEKREAEEVIGRHVAQTILTSMGFTAFRTPDELVLIRGNERVDVGVGRTTPSFGRLLYLASGLTHSKANHRSYISAAVYFLELGSTKARDVSWSYYDADNGSVFFPTGDANGSILRIAAGAVYLTRMADLRVPAVTGENFAPIEYAKDCGGAIEEALETLRWISLSPSDRMLLVYWLVCLPILRKIGQVPIVRIEGGSSSGKSRAVDAIAYLVNGRKTSVVPTAAAMTSVLAAQMLTIDDNREKRDMNESLISTLLQATGQGARQKRSVNTDTGTTTERVTGALLMNGIEPVHDGRSELASRFLTLRCDSRWRSADSPQADEAVCVALLEGRNRFWSEAAHRCAQALDLDERWGEAIGQEIEGLFGETRIGRLARYLRLMYLAWVAGQPLDEQQAHLDRVSPEWVRTFSEAGAVALKSLLHEELSVSAMRYAFAYCRSLAKQPTLTDDYRYAVDGCYKDCISTGDASLGPLSSSQLARLVRTAAKEGNAPKTLAVDLSAGQLLARIQDGLGFLRDAGFAVVFQTTGRGKLRMIVYRAATGADPTQAPDPALGGPDTWSTAAS